MKKKTQQRKQSPKKQNRQKAYLTKNNLLVTDSTLLRFKKCIFSILYNGPKRFRWAFYRQIAHFLEHLICVTTSSRKSKEKAKFKGDNDWTYSVPLSAVLGKAKLKHVFEQEKYLPHTPALELLENAGLIKISKHSHATGKCREFSLSKRFLHELFGDDREAYLSKTDRYTYLNNIANKQKSYTFDELIGLAVSKGLEVKAKPKHWLSVRDIPNPVFRGRLSTVWGNLKPLEINLDKLLGYYRKNPTPRNKIFVFSFLSHLATVGVSLVRYSPLVVTYRQTYRSAKIGGRSFEVGSGFQSLPAKMKWACLAQGYNYDIKGCQLEILRHELQAIGISDKSLRLLETGFICRTLGVKEALVKQFRFASVFNEGYVSLSFKSKTVRLLNREFGEVKAREVLLRWRDHLIPLRGDLSRLIAHYQSLGKTNGYGTSVVNAVGQPFNCTYKNINKKDPRTGETVTIRKQRRSDEMRRKLLSHMLQGLESQAVYDFVAQAKHIEVCALEHDGFVSYQPVVKEWVHPYLKIVQKN